MITVVMRLNFMHRKRCRCWRSMFEEKMVEQDFKFVPFTKASPIGLYRTLKDKSGVIVKQNLNKNYLCRALK